MAELLNVALLGYGYAGRTFHAPLITAVPGLHLDTVVSSKGAAVKADLPSVTVVPTADEAFADSSLQLIVIATPNDTHFDLSRKALLAGKHVVVDKPFTTTVAEADELTTLAARSDRVLSVFHNRRWDSDYLTLRHVLAGGRLGEIVQFESRLDRWRPEVRQRWREQPGPGSGLWYDLGPHLTDQALQLFGVPQAVFADLEAQRHNAAAVDYFHVLLRCGRQRIILHCSSLAAASTPRFSVFGTNGSYVKHGIDRQEEALKRGEKPGRPGWGRDPDEGMLTIGQGETEAVANLPGNYLAYYEAVRDAILTGSPNPVPPNQALQVMSVLERAVQSSAARRELPLS